MEVNSWTIMLVGIGITVFALFSYAYWKDWQFKKMRPRPRTIMLIGIGATVLTMASHAYWIDWRFDKVYVYAGDQSAYIDDYRDYIYKSEPVGFKNWFGATWSGRTLYFLPKERDKMLEKIKEDIIAYLDQMVGEHGDIFPKYEVSDDFSQMRIYQAALDIINANKPSVVWANSRFSVHLFSFYHSVKKGHPAYMNDDYTFEVIKLPDTSFDY